MCVYAREYRGVLGGRWYVAVPGAVCKFKIHVLLINISGYCYLVLAPRRFCAGGFHVIADNMNQKTAFVSLLLMPVGYAGLSILVL